MITLEWLSLREQDRKTFHQENKESHNPFEKGTAQPHSKTIQTKEVQGLAKVVAGQETLKAWTRFDAIECILGHFPRSDLLPFLSKMIALRYKIHYMRNDLVD